VNALPPEAGRRNERILAVVVFVVFLGFALVTPFLALYVRALGVLETRVAFWAGIQTGVSPLFAGLLSPLWGRLADRYGHKVMVTRSLVSYVFILALSAVVGNVWQLLALRIAVGVFGGIGPMAIVMASSSAPKGDAGRAIGMMQAAQILAAAAGPLSGGFLADTIGIRPTFLLTAALCALALVLVQGYYQEVPRSPRETPLPTSPASDGTTAMGRGTLLGLMTLLFLVNFVSRSFAPVLPQQIERLGVSGSRIGSATGLVASFFSIAAAITAATVGRAARNRDPRVLLQASCLATGMLLVPIPAVPSFRGLLMLATLVGFAYGGALTLGYTIGDRMAPSERRGAIFGYFTGAALFGGALGPLAAGYVALWWDLAGIYYLDAASCLLVALALSLVRARALASRAG
jgi:DHA1 family multidrug resistance protein-like MFS transporter